MSEPPEILDYAGPRDERATREEAGVGWAIASWVAFIVPLMGFLGGIAPAALVGFLALPGGFLFGVLGASAPAATTSTRLLAGFGGALNGLATLALYAAWFVR